MNACRLRMKYTCRNVSAVRFYCDYSTDVRKRHFRGIMRPALKSLPFTPDHGAPSLLSLLFEVFLSFLTINFYYMSLTWKQLLSKRRRSLQSYRKTFEAANKVNFALTEQGLLAEFTDLLMDKFYLKVLFMYYVFYVFWNTSLIDSFTQTDLLV